MILSRDAYARLRAAEERAALSRLTPEESLALGEALWTSSLVSTRPIVPEPRGLSFGRRLGIWPHSPVARRTVART